MNTIPNQVEVGVNPAKRGQAQRDMLLRIQLMRAVYGGTETMREMGNIILTQYPHETAARYNERLQAATAVNKLREAVTSVSAKPFMTRLTASLPNPTDNEELQKLICDIDQNGHDIHLFGHSFFNDAVLCGVCYILIDKQTTVPVSTLAQQRTAAGRPFMRMIKADDLLDIKEGLIDGVWQITHVRFRTSRMVTNPETFEEIIYDQVWVLDHDRTRLYERERIALAAQTLTPVLAPGGTINPSRTFQQNYTDLNLSNSNWVKMKDEPRPSSSIPIVKMVAGDEDSPGFVKPIFQDLAYKQIEHYNSNSDQQNILSASRFPMLAVSGAKADVEGEEGTGFEIGPWKILTTDDANAKWYFVETKGTAIEQGFKHLDLCEMHMNMMSLNPTVSIHRQYISQNERSLEENRVNTVIHDFAVTCQAALERALMFMGQYLGRDWSEVKVNMNYNFAGTDERSKFAQTMINAHKFGVLSRAAALDELRRFDAISSDFDIEAELKRDSPVSTTGTGVSVSDQTGTNPTA